MYKALIGTPESLSGGVAPATSSALNLPAGGNLGISYSVGVAAGELLANTAGGRILGSPALNADEIHRIGWFEKDVDVDLEINASKAGTATLHHLDDWRLPDAIATAIFT